MARWPRAKLLRPALQSHASSSAEGSVVAFQVSMGGIRSQEVAADENVGDIPADASKAVRPLMVRPSDEVDFHFAPQPETIFGRRVQ